MPLDAVALPRGAAARQVRAASWIADSVDEKNRTVGIAFSSEAPVVRYWGTEILGHSRGEMVVDWIAGGTAPVLCDHDPRDVVGVVEAVTLGSDRKARAVVRFGTSARAEEVFRDVVDGIRLNVSVGYELLEVIPEKEEPGKPTVYRAVKWRPLEVSFVSIPADMTVGVGRGAALPESIPKPSSERKPMTINPTAGAGAPDPATAARHAEILALADLANNRQAGVDAILRGQDVEAFRRDLLASRSNTGNPLVVPAQGAHDEAFARELARVSLGDVIRAGMGLRDAGAGRAVEMSAELQRRSGRKAQGIMWDTGASRAAERESRIFTTTNPGGGPGSNIIATDHRPDLFIERLYPQVRVRELGATLLSGLVGNVDIPRLSASVTTWWVAENSALTASDPQTDKVSLSPKHAGALVEYSRNMLLQPSIAIESLLQDDMARMLAVALDTAAIAGTGSSNQPRGVLNTVGIGSVAMGTNGAALTYDAVADLVGQVADTNAELGRLAFLTNTKVRRAAAKLKDSQNRPLGQEVVFQGMPAAFTNIVPSNLTKGTATAICSALVYGNWSELLLGIWSELDILVNPYETTAYSKGNVQVRAMMTVDIAVRHPASFAAILDILA